MHSMAKEADKPKQPTLQEYVSTLRNQIVLSYDGAKEVATKNFDDIVAKFAVLYNEKLAQQEVKDNKDLAKEVKPDKETPKKR